MIKAVIFDMDGLILDTEKLLIRFWVQAANEAGFPMKREQALKIRSMHRSFAIPYLQGLFGNEFDYAKIRSRRMSLMSDWLGSHELEIKPGVVELLDHLNKRKIPAAVCTATDYERTRDYLTRAGVFDRFDKIICAAMVEFGKPRPDIYLYVAKQLGLSPWECMALEDSPNGVKSAAEAGCAAVMIPDLTEPDEELDGVSFTRADSLLNIINMI